MGDSPATPRRGYVSLDGAKASLVAFNAEATTERLMDALESLRAPLPGGAVGHGRTSRSLS